MALKIFSLDLGQHTGWAGLTDDGLIVSGTNHFVPCRFEGGGMIWLRFRAWLEEVHKAEPIAAIVFEEVRRHRGTTAAHMYGGFLSHLTAFAEHHGIPYSGVTVQAIKKFACGKGNASKVDVTAAMIRRGHSPGDDNEADALALLHWAMAQPQFDSDVPQKPRLAARASDSSEYSM